MKPQPQAFKKQVITFVGLLLLIVLLVCFRQSPDMVEKYYYGGVYQLLCHITRPITNIFPFSLGDVFYGIIILLLIIGLIRLLRFLFIKQFKQAGKLMLRFLFAWK